MNEAEKQSSQPRAAAAYVRMSTEHQQYSTCNQLAAISDYARRRGLEIVKVYSDEGKSGLTVRNRDALNQMIQDVQQRDVGFSSILVYDVSRWGRFQDADESAYYEYRCRQNGVQVHYCAEQFENDGSPTATIVKSVKRAMAGEFSRELSHKVFEGQCRLVQLGFRQGGTSGLGLRRMLVDQQGRPKAVLQHGERKSIASDRIIIVPGPDEEIKLVQKIYQMFIEERRHERQIAAALNERGLRTEQGRIWTFEKIRDILTNEKYIGNNVYHRRSAKLKARTTWNPPEKWVRADGVFQGIIAKERFLAARDIFQARRRKYDKGEMLAGLQKLFQQHGYLAAKLINECGTLPKAACFARCFGSLIGAYELVGFKARVRESWTPLTRRLFAATGELGLALAQRAETAGAEVEWEGRAQMLYLNRELRVYVLFVRCSVSNFGTRRWVIRLRPKQKPDLTIIVRMTAQNDEIRDYYLLPSLGLDWTDTQFAENNGICFDVFRFPSLDFFVRLAARSQLPKTYERRDPTDSH